MVRRLQNQLPSPGPYLKRRALQVYRHLRTQVYVISFPKSGRTWLRMMLGIALAEDAGLHLDSMLRLPRMVTGRGTPRVSITHDDDPHHKRPEDLAGNKSKYARKRVIFLARDPRDVVVSAYFQRTKRDKDYGETLDDFISSRTGSLDSIIRFYNIWASNRHVPRAFMLLRYEDLRRNPHAELRRLFSFIGRADIQGTAVDKAVEETQFERMQGLERSGAVDSFRMTPGDADDPESFKVRRGKVGGYLDYLSEEQIWHIENRVNGELDDMFGYKYTSRK